MKTYKDNILIYSLLGAGYLLFCSALPTMIAINAAEILGGNVNNYYAPFSFITGVIYIGMVFAWMGEKLDLTKNFSLKGVGEAILTAIILFVVINFMVSPLLSVAFPSSAGNYDNSVADMMTTPVATFFQVVLIAPLFEELIFRGLIMKRALRWCSTGASVLMTAVLFGVLHLSIVQGISAAAAGIVLCVFYGRRKSVGLNILAHSIYNGMVFGLAMLLY